MAMTRLPPDFKEFLKLLKEHDGFQKIVLINCGKTKREIHA